MLLFVSCATTQTSEDEPRKNLSKHDKAMLHLQVANAAIMEGDIAAAFQNLKAAEELDSNIPEIFHSRAVAYSLKKELPAAIAAARKALEIRPSFTKAANTLGKLLMDNGSLNEAEKYLLQASADETNNEAFKADTNLGILYYRKSEYKKAEKFLNRAILQGKLGSCVAHYYRGHLALKDGKFQNAITDYEKATQKVCANFGEAHLALGIAYERNHELEKARKKFLSIDQTFPKSKVAEQALIRLKAIP